MEPIAPTCWAASKDLVCGSLKKMPISSIIQLFPGKKYAQFSPKNYQDHSSRLKYARVKREKDGVIRYRPIRIRHLRGTEAEIDSMMRNNQIKNPQCKLLQGGLLSEFILASEKRDAKQKKAERKTPNLSDGDRILKNLKKQSQSDGGPVPVKKQRTDEGQSDSNQAADLDLSAESEKVDRTDQIEPVKVDVSSPDHPSKSEKETKESDAEKDDLKTSASTSILDISFPNQPSKSITGTQESNDENDCANTGADIESLTGDQVMLPDRTSSKASICGEYKVSSSNNASAFQPSSIHLDQVVTMVEKNNSCQNVTNRITSEPVRFFGEETACCDIRDLVNEVKRLSNEVADLKALLTTKSEAVPRPHVASASQLDSNLWPIYNAVDINISAPKGTPSGMIFCGETACSLGVMPVERIILGDKTSRNKIQSLAGLMFPTDLPNYCLRVVGSCSTRKLFPEDARIALTNLVNIGFEIRNEPGNRITSADTSDFLSKILNLLRAGPKDTTTKPAV